MEIVIFGSGYHGRLAMRKMSNVNSRRNIISFIDNNKEKYNKICLGKRIYPVQQIRNLNFDYIVMCGRNIHKQLIQLKIYNIPLKKYLFLGKSEIRPKNTLIKKRSKIFYTMLKELIPILEKNKIKYWMDYSGLLSLMRGENFGELSDVEISIDYNEINKMINFLKNCKTFSTKYIFVKNKKFILKNKTKFNRICLFSKYKKIDIERPHIDLIIKIIKKDHSYNMFLENTSQLKYWIKTNSKSYKSLNLKIPRFAKSYLKTLYGSNWRISSEFWGFQNNKLKSVSKNFYYKLLRN